MIRNPGTTATCRTKKFARVGAPTSGPPRKRAAARSRKPEYSPSMLVQMVHRPVGQLIPGKQIAGEIGAKHKEQQKQTNDPVDATPRIESPGENDPYHVQQDDADEKIGTPVMDISDPESEGRLLSQGPGWTNKRDRRKGSYTSSKRTPVEKRRPISVAAVPPSPQLKVNRKVDSGTDGGCRCSRKSENDRRLFGICEVITIINVIGTDRIRIVSPFTPALNTNDSHLTVVRKIV